MRRLVLFFVLAFAAPAYATGEPAPPAAATETAPAAATQTAPAAGAMPLSENPEARQEPIGRSGFWTNPYPAKGGAYRWRMMGIGIALIIGMGWFMWRLVKKAGAERAARGR